MKKILCYSTNKEKIKGLEDLCEKLGYGFSEIEYKDIGKELLVLLSDGETSENIGKHDAVPPMYVMPEMMILKDFQAEEIDGILPFLKSIPGGLGFIAVVTPYNIVWTVYELSKELIKEHEYIKKNEKSSQS